MRRILLYALILPVLFTFSLNAQVSQAEFDALVDLYNATNGDSWTNNTNWNINGTKDDVTSDWYGLTINSGYVQSINLAGNNLTGTIPESICDFYRLSSLQLYDNNLTGSLPENIFVFSSYLQILYLNNNQLSGSIPTKIYNVSQFRLLNLGENNLSGNIPKELGVLRYLTTIQLYNNSLSGKIPEELGNISTLGTLNLSGNQLTGEIPAELGDATNMSYLNLSNNLLSGSLPPELSSLNKLSMLYLFNNQLSGDIPSEFQALSALAYVRINNNQFSGMPNLTTLPLANLWIENNRFTFADLETNVTKLTGTHLSPQAKIGQEEYVYMSIGSSKTLTVTVDGSHNSYQWYKDDVAISGATSSSYTISNFQLSNEGIYYCRISNSVVTALILESNPVGLTSTATPAITVQPESLTDFCVNGTAEYHVESQYGVSYQWQEKSPTGSWQNISGETEWTGANSNAIRSVKSLLTHLEGYSYRCLVTNPNGTSTSIGAELLLDGIAPTLEVHDLELTLNQDEMALISPSSLITSVSDNCSTINTSINNSNFDCSDIGAPVPVNVTAYDGMGNSVTKVAYVTVKEDEDPVLTIQNITIELDENGSASIKAKDVVSSASDNCSIADTLLSRNTFDCSDLGTSAAVDVTLSDISGNTASKRVYVTVLDKIDPVLSVQDITLILDENNSAELLARDVVTSAVDNCAPADTLLSQQTFDCSNAGAPFIVDVTLRDASGNETMEQINVTVEDHTDPELEVKDLTLILDENGVAGLEAKDVVSAATDNCSLADTTLSRKSFDCSDTQAPVTIDIRLRDASGNEKVKQAVITVTDNTAPTLSIQDITLYLDENGTATLSAKDVVTAASDNCSLADTLLSSYTFDCSHAGSPRTIDVTLKDVSGNETVEQLTVTVADNLAPELNLQEISLELDSNGQAELSSVEVVTYAGDNCSLADTTLSRTSFGVDDKGIQTIDVTLSDIFGNETSAQVEVTINANSSGKSRKSDESISIYPNPARDIFRIASAGTIEEIQIIDSFGRFIMVEKAVDSDKEIDISSLDAGIYFVNIRSGDQFTRLKLIRE